MLENFPGGMITVKSKTLKISTHGGYAAETESNFCVHISSTETNDDIDAVLENFPVIYFCNKK